MKIITTKGGQGRQENPYHYKAFKGRAGWDAKYIEFEDNHPFFPVYDTEGNLYMGEGEVEATLIMQERMKPNHQWQYCVVDGYDPIVKTEYDTRQIYRISTTVKQEKESVDDFVRKILIRAKDNVRITGEWIGNHLGNEICVYGTLEDESILNADYSDIIKQSNLIDRDKVIELINVLRSNYNDKNNHYTDELTELITKIKHI